MRDLVNAASSLPFLWGSDSLSGNEPTVGDLWWQFLFYLLIVIVVVFLAWFVTRFFAERSAPLPQSRYMHILDRLQLAPNRCIYLVSVAGKILVIGQGDRDLSLLSSMDEEDLIQFLEENPLPELDDRGMTFLKNLQENLTKMKR